MSKRIRHAACIFGLAALLAGCETAEDYVKELGYVPIIPPNRLAIPGPLYLVDESQKNPNKVCSTKNVKFDVAESPTESAKRTLQSKGNISFSADAVKKLNAQIGANFVTSVSLVVTDAKVRQITEGELWQIRTELLKQGGCNNVVEAFLVMNKKICQGREALILTSNYESSVTFGASISASTKDELVNRLGAELGGQATLGPTGKVVVNSGEKLIYGLKMSELCLYLDKNGHSPQKFEQIVAN